MLRVLKARLQQGHRTFPFPKREPVISEAYRGRPSIDPAKCPAGCAVCAENCPVGAIRHAENGIRLDLGRCVFCMECVDACPQGAIRFTGDFAMATRSREDLILEGDTIRLAEALDAKARSLFGRSLKLRQVSAGGCNACEADTNVLNTLAFDLARFGIQFVASPRHADGLLVTGPITENMVLALEKTWAAVPEPKLVIAVGACAISGGVFRDHQETNNGMDGMSVDSASEASEKGFRVDLYVPGCPPHPYTILDGLLRLLGRRGK
jgi:Ni,Fe-hydrogenase III small subunit/formate hydrogenlyase subunit 6/NADH:ubiquinone oxidoreductase subunit I